MFLNRLTPTEKESFLAVAHHIANSDNNFSSEEELIIAKYCMEMQIDDIKYDSSKFDLKNLLSKFENDSHKNIALLEIMALIYADGKVAEQEEYLLKEVTDYFDINPMLIIAYKEWSKSITSLLVQGEALIYL